MSSRRRPLLLVILLLLALAIALLLLRRCSAPAPVGQAPAATPAPKQAQAAAPAAPAAPPAQPAEVLTPATLRAPATVAAGAAFAVAWTGPGNYGDYVTIVPPTAAAGAYQNYRDTRDGAELTLTAPMEPGDWEIRYVTLRSKTVLARVPLTVTPVAATLAAAEAAVLGAPVSIAWTGPNNANDFITIVAAAASDVQVGPYAETKQGSPVVITAPTDAGPAEIRYISGQGRRVLARRALQLTVPETSLGAPEEVVAGARFSATWTGPNNKGDYLTIVPASAPDGQYGSYRETEKGSPVELVAPIEAGPAEVRYITGGQARVLARRRLVVRAAAITLEAPAEVLAGAPVEVTWTGPSNKGDYLTLVPHGTPDGQYGNYADVTKGSPLTLQAPIHVGRAEIRYMSGQGARVLARREITLRAAHVDLRVPSSAAPGEKISVTWTGPNHRNDYLTLVPRATRDGTAHRTHPTERPAPATFAVPAERGLYEVRYVSGQGGKVLARAPLEVR